MRYLRYELMRTVRNRQGFIFTLIFPLAFYFLLAVPNKNDHSYSNVPGLWAPQYYMVSLLGYAGIVAAVSCGAFIAAERGAGWNRQLRITPLRASAYFGAKVANGYFMATLVIVLLYVLGISVGVRLGAATWVVMTALVLLALVPFIALGIGLGHLLRPDAFGAAAGGGTAVLAFLGGAWFPITGGGWFPALCKLLPSWWVVQAGQVGLEQSKNPWGVQGWIVVACWALALAAFARWAYLRDTRRT